MWDNKSMARRYVIMYHVPLFASKQPPCPNNSFALLQLERWGVLWQLAVLQCQANHTGPHVSGFAAAPPPPPPICNQHSEAITLPC